MQKSKIGFNVAGRHNNGTVTKPLIGEVKPRVMVLFTSEVAGRDWIENWYNDPNGEIFYVFRHGYMEDDFTQIMSEANWNVDRAVANTIGNERTQQAINLAADYGGVVHGVNEPNKPSGNVESFYAALVEYSFKMAQELEARYGVGYCAWNLATGNPIDEESMDAFKNAPYWPQFKNMADKDSFYQLYVGLHEYSGGHLAFWYGPNQNDALAKGQKFFEYPRNYWTENYLMCRYRKTYDYWGVEFKTIITEAGWDFTGNHQYYHLMSLNLTNENKGYRFWNLKDLGVSTLQLLWQLAWYDYQLQQDDYVVGAALFHIGHYGETFTDMDLTKNDPATHSPPVLAIAHDIIATQSVVPPTHPEEPTEHPEPVPVKNKRFMDYVITVKETSLKDAPSENGKTLTTVVNGEMGAVGNEVNEDGTFISAYFDSAWGWVAVDDIISDPAFDITLLSEPSLVRALEPIPVYHGPSNKFFEKGTIPIGEKFEITDSIKPLIDNFWYVEDLEGWISVYAEVEPVVVDPIQEQSIVQILIILGMIIGGVISIVLLGS